MEYKDYKELNLSIDTETAIARFNDTIDIEVKQYLPIQDKIDLVQIALQQSWENGFYNEVKLDMYFHLYIVYFYSNLVFSPEDREDEYKLFDELESNDVIISIIGAMEENEYERLKYYLSALKESTINYKSSAAAVVNSIVQDLPKNAAAAAEIVEGFDKEKYAEVVAFAKAANGNRPIPVEENS